jgi:hypothetical protein
MERASVLEFRGVSDGSRSSTTARRGSFRGRISGRASSGQRPRSRLPSRSPWVVVFITAIVVAVSLVGAASPGGVISAAAPLPVTPPPGTSATPSGVSPMTSALPTPIQHVVVVLMENQNYSTVLSTGPFEAYLARTYASASNDYSVHHYSIPAYLAATSGIDSTGYSVYNDQNLGDLADAANRTWAAFEQGMPQVCDRTTNWSDGYDDAHNPFVMYKDIESNATRCDAHDLTWSSWTNDVGLSSIPNYSFITPNTTDDDHNSTIPVGDAWLKSWLSPLVNDSAIFSNTAFLISYDESGDDSSPSVNGSSGGHVYAVVVSPYSRGLSSNVFYNTFSLLTTAEWLLGLPGGSLVADSWTLHPPMEGLFDFPTKSYPVTLTESGLPAGSSWSVSVDGLRQTSTTSAITFPEPNGTHAFAVGAMPGYLATPSTGSVSVAGGTQSISVQFARAYSVTFVEAGLPKGTPWNVSLGGTNENSTSTSAVFYEPNGSYGFRYGSVPGWRTTWSGSTLVAGQAVRISKTFSPFLYVVTIRESGLPPGTSWSVTVGTSDILSRMTYVNFHLSNGSYGYSVSSVGNYSRLPTGTVVVQGSNVTVVEKFSLVKYVVTMKETGLPSGTNWSVTVGSSTVWSTLSYINFHLPNGTYPYSVGDLANFTEISSGNFTISGSGFTLTTVFSHVKIPATLKEFVPPQKRLPGVTMTPARPSALPDRSPVGKSWASDGTAVPSAANPLPIGQAFAAPSDGRA